jgi:hypothetical protein
MSFIKHYEATMEDHDDRTPITPPIQHQGRDLTRTIAESLAEIVPGGSIVTGILRETFPSKSDQVREDWETAITERSNQHGERLDRHDDMLAPSETIEGLPARLLARLAQECPDGMSMHDYDLDALRALFPDDDRQAIKDAVADLKALGLLKSWDYIGGWRIAVAEDAYEQVDPQVMGWDTKADAVAIARLMLAGNTGHAPELHEKTGWSKRRFNPAFRLLLPLFPEGRIRRVMQPDYPSLGVVLADDDRAKLRRLVARAGGA